MLEKFFQDILEYREQLSKYKKEYENMSGIP
jgi:hypothetical protein